MEVVEEKKPEKQDFGFSANLEDENIIEDA